MEFYHAELEERAFRRLVETEQLAELHLLLSREEYDEAIKELELAKANPKLAFRALQSGSRLFSKSKNWREPKRSF